MCWFRLKREEEEERSRARTGERDEERREMRRMGRGECIWVVFGLGFEI